MTEQGKAADEARERERARSRAYYAAHRDEQRKKGLEYYHAHRDEILAKRRAQAKTDLEARRKKKAEYEAKRREKVRSGEVEVKHGADYGYNMGCRCELCKSAHSLRRAKGKADLLKLRSERVPIERMGLVDYAKSLDRVVVHMAGGEQRTYEFPPCEEGER